VSAKERKISDVQRSLLFLGMSGMKRWARRKTPPGSRIMPSKPIVSGAMTSFVAVIGSGCVHPLLVI
jgi:hypothetical protein